MMRLRIFRTGGRQKYHPDDVRPMLEQMVKEAVSHIPAPRDGRDYDPEVLKQAVNDAVANIPVPADGKSITPDDVRPMLSRW